MAMLRTLLLLACIVACCTAYYIGGYRGYGGYGGYDDDYYPHAGYRAPLYRSYFPRRLGYYGHGMYYDKK